MILLMDICETLARRNVLWAGGEVKTDKFGNEILVIESEEVETVDFESSSNPDSPVGIKFTDYELKQIKQ